MNPPLDRDGLPARPVLILDWSRAPLGWRVRSQHPRADELGVDDVLIRDAAGELVARFVVEGSEIAGRGFVEVYAGRLTFDPVERRTILQLGGDALFRQGIETGGA